MVHLVDTPDIQDALDELEELRRKVADDILTDKIGLGVIPKQLTTIESSSSDEDGDDDDDDDNESRGDQSHAIIFPKKRDFYHRTGRAAMKRKNHERVYPPACLFFLRLFPDNDCCMDCGECNPSFAFSTFGVLLCSMCSSSIDHVESDESHVLSLDTLDQWNIHSVLSTLLGGNRNMKMFLETDIDEENQHITKNFVDHRLYSTDSAARYCKKLESVVEETIGQNTPLSEDIFKNTTYWIAKYQPPNILNANRALLALCATDTTNVTTPTGTKSSTSSRSGLAAIANQSRRASFQASAKSISFTKRTSTGSFRSSIASFTSLFDSPQQRVKESSTTNVHSNLTATAVSTATITTMAPSPDEVKLVTRISFPPECIFFLRLLPGNDKCLDCGVFNPQFANTNFGILLCLHCCEKHCQIGFQSKIKSLWTDRWTLADVLYMMEGGNGEFLSCNFDSDNNNSKSIYHPSTSPPYGNMAPRTFSTVVMRRGSVDNSLSQVKSITRRRRTMDHISGAMDLAERYNCKLATHYRSQLTQKVILSATKHGVPIPERYLQ